MDKPDMHDVRVILVQDDSPVLRFAAQELARFWNRSCGTEISVREGAQEALSPGWCWAGRLSRTCGKIRHDGFELRGKHLSNGAAWEVIGNNDPGAKQGLWQLLREAKLKPGKVMLPKRLRARKSPFFRERYAMLSTPLLWNQFLTPMEDRFAYQTWSGKARLEYVSAVDMLGFNAVQVSDEVGERYAFRFEKPREHWFEELCELLKHAGKLGLHRILFMWGASIGLPAPEGAPNVFSSRGFNPADPADAPVWEDHLQYLSGYAPYIDELLTHWGDPGGFDGATIEDAQRIHMRIWGEFRKKNPALRSIFSLWMLHHQHYGRWSGYQGPQTIIDSGILPKKVSLAMHARINVEEARLIKESGRRCGPWVWYMADNEIFPGLHVHTGWLEEYFQKLPPGIGEIVDFHGVEMNCHQLNYPSVYVAARKLWDPYEPADRLLSEFCRLVFGPSAGQIMLQGYQAVAHTRCVSDYGHRDVILGLKSEGTKRYLENPEAEGEEVRSAIQAMDKVEIDGDWIPRIPLPSTPRQMLEDLKVHLREISAFTRFRMDLREVEAGRKSAAELVDWQRPDGYLLMPEKQQVQGVLRELSEKP